MNKFLSLSLCSLLIGTSLSSASAVAETRLERIERTGIFVAGYRETAVPFSFLDPYKPAGFGVDITYRILDALRTELKRPDIQLRWNPVTLSTRIPMMTTNTIDVNCATDSHTKAREALVDFSVTYFVSELAAAVPVESDIKSMAHLKGKRVIVPESTTVETLMANQATQVIEQQQTKVFDLMTIPTNRQAMQAVQTGQADAFVNAATIVGGELFRLKDAQNFKVVNLGGQSEPFACMLPRGDKKFKALVDQALSTMMTSGEMETLYNKWFVSPLKTYRKGLNMPINESTLEAYANPNDSKYVF